MKPAEIRRVRTRLRFSQPEFAEFLCTRGRNSPKLGTRLPQTTKFGTPTISYCERKTGVTPTKTRLISKLSSVDGPTLSELFDKVRLGEMFSRRLENAKHRSRAMDQATMLSPVSCRLGVAC